MLLLCEAVHQRNLILFYKTYSNMLLLMKNSINLIKLHLTFVTRRLIYE